jgi:hypothetical protein
LSIAWAADHYRDQKAQVSPQREGQKAHLGKISKRNLYEYNQSVRQKTCVVNSESLRRVASQQRYTRYSDIGTVEAKGAGPHLTMFRDRLPRTFFAVSSDQQMRSEVRDPQFEFMATAAKTRL